MHYSNKGYRCAFSQKGHAIRVTFSPEQRKYTGCFSTGYHSACTPENAISCARQWALDNGRVDILCAKRAKAKPYNTPAGLAGFDVYFK